MEKKTLVLGASTNAERFSFQAVRKLKFGHVPVVAVGLREGEIHGVKVEKPFPKFENIHTVTLYIGPKNLPAYFDYIISLHPRRVIFNPGTEEPAFANRLREEGIEVVFACTLIMLSNGRY
jgi:predicted CoA-binding protein